MASFMVAVDGIKIDSFEASATMVNRMDPVDLSWTISGEAPMSVTIETDGGDEVYSGNAAAGSVTVRPLADVTYTLTAEGTTGTKTAMVSISVVSSRPTITRFECVPDNVVQINVEEANLVWATTADEVQILQDGVPVRPWTNIAAPAGNLQRPVTMPTTVFTLQARNLSDMADVVEQTITVMGLETPTIVRFDVSPTEYTQASTMVTVDWEVTTTDSVEIRLNNTRLPGFPTTDTSGTLTVPVSGEPLIRILATNMVTTVERTQRISFGYDDPEPNDSGPNAIPLSGDGVAVRGTVSTSTDADWYSVVVPQGARMSVRAGFVKIMGFDVCQFDTLVRVYTSTGAEVAFNDNGPTGVAPCSFMNAFTAPALQDMAAGTYYVSVEGTGTMPVGQYEIEVRIGDPPTANSTITAVGTPAWNVGEIVLWSAPAGMGPEAVIEIDELFDGVHTFAAFDLLTVLTSPAEALPSADWDFLLPLMLEAMTRRVNNTFPAAALATPNAIYLGYTIYPDGTTTGSSFDAASGPIIPNGLYPFTIDMAVTQNGGPYIDADPAEIPSYAGFATFIPPGGAAPLDAVPGAGQGDTYRHLVSLIADFLSVAPGGNLAGTYVWTLNLRDTTMAGYDIVVSFTLQ